MRVGRFLHEGAQLGGNLALFAMSLLAGSRAPGGSRSAWRRPSDRRARRPE
jgi:hypothetical protein